MQDGDGTYSSGDESTFNVSLGTNPDAAAIAALTSQYLQFSIGATALQGASFNAAAAGNSLLRGQSLWIPTGQYDFGNTPNLQVTGTAFVAVKNVPFTGIVADIAPNADNPSGNYSAAILWGDGSESTGTLTPDGSGGYYVIGSHTYGDLVETSYPVAVQVTDLNTGLVGVGGTFGLILPPDDNSVFQAPSDISVSYTPTASQSGGVNGSTYSVQTTGNLNYTLTYQLNNIGSVESVSRTGSASFSVAENGDIGFDLGQYSLNDNDDATVTMSTAANDLVVNSLTSETDNDNVAYQKTGNGITGLFAASWNTTIASSSQANGTDGTGSFAKASTGTKTESGQQNGTYSTGDYLLTETDSSTAAVQTTGNHFDDFYVDNESDSSTLSRSETGNIFAETFAITDNGTDSSTIAETATNPAGGYTQTTNNSDSYTSTISGDDLSGDYNLAKTITASSSYQTSGNALVETYTQSYSGATNSQVTISGNLGTGNYTSATNSSTSSNEQDGTVDQTDTDTDAMTDSDSSTVAETGNIFSRRLLERIRTRTP